LGKSNQAVIDALVTLFKVQSIYVESTDMVSPAQFRKSVPVSVLIDRNQDVHSRAAKSLVQLGKSDPAVVDAFVSLLKDQDSDVRYRAAESVGQLRKSAPAVIDALVALLKDQASHVRHTAAISLGQLGRSEPVVIDALVTLLKDKGDFLRNSSANAIGVLGQKRDDWTDERMIVDLADFDSGVRERSGIVLAWRDDKLKPLTRQKVEALRKDSRSWVRQASLHALYHIEKRKAELAEQAHMKAEVEAAKAK
jgi:HEAT repeat protein